MEGDLRFDLRIAQTGPILGDTAFQCAVAVHRETSDLLLPGSQRQILLGGGIFMGSGSAVLTDTLISHNTANYVSSVRGGGGLFITDGDLTMIDGQIVHNSAEQDGGGVFIRESTASFTQTGDTLIAYNWKELLGPFDRDPATIRW